MFSAAQDFIKKRAQMDVFVVAGGGQWALEYAKALHWFIAQKQVAAIFVYKSDYGIGTPGYHRYLERTIRNMIEAERLGALCIDLSRLTKSERYGLPALIQPLAVFVVTPPETHCENALQWAPHAKHVLIEKPFDTSTKAVQKLREQLGTDGSKRVFGYDHYAARLKPFLAEDKLEKLKLGRRCKFVFEMFEAAPRGLEERAPSLARTGMLFDMASHALPVLSWLIEDFGELAGPNRYELYVSTLCSPTTGEAYIASETFARLTFEFKPRTSLGTGDVTAEIRVGKGIGVTDSKLVTLGDEEQQDAVYLDQLFMLARLREAVKPIHERVIHRLVQDVRSNDLQNSDGVFDLDLGETIVKVLQRWTSKLDKHVKTNKLPTYHQGMECEKIWSDEKHRYRLEP